MHLAAILLVLQGVASHTAAAGDTVPRFRPDSLAIASAYADASTRELVRRARLHRGVIDASVSRYRATVRQRASLGLRALRRDRLIFRRETAALLDWRRDGPNVIEVRGAREAVPMALPGVRVPEDLERLALDLLPEPGDDRLFFAPDEGGFAWHPLVEGGEAVYRYATGDTTVIRLPDGRSIRLVELRVTPRERDIRLVTGSFWIELDGHAIVQAVFRPSREFDLERDLPAIDPDDADDMDDVPGLLKPVRLDLRYMAIEYGLWEMRWWMPRLVALNGHLQMGAARFPISFETAYSDYRVEADPYGLPALPPVIRSLAGDPHSRPRAYQHGTRVVVADSAELVSDPLLPESFYSPGEALLSEQEVRSLAERIAAIPPPPWEARKPRATWPWEFGRGLLRYNRVEGLSVGARVDWDLTRARVDLTARVATADLDPSAEAGFELPTLRRSWRAAAYHRLVAVDPGLRPFGLGNSLSAALFGRDDGLYYRATGAELRLTPAPGEPRYELRLYAETQREAPRRTDFSLAHVLDDGHTFRPNIAADAAEQAGLTAALGLERGLDPGGLRWGAWLDLDAEVGTYDFARPGLRVHLAAPLFGRLLGAVEAAAGTTIGAGAAPSPVQSRWHVGGPTTVRGFPPGYAAGVDHVRGRIELANDFPAARVVLFSDAGWAGAFDTLARPDVLLSAGIGVSVLDGLLRVDLARTIQPREGWRLESYLDALF